MLLPKLLISTIRDLILIQYLNCRIILNDET